MPILVLIFGAGLLLFLAVSPNKPWILLLVTGLVAIGTDGILREHPHAQRENDLVWTAPLLFLPTLLRWAPASSSSRRSMATGSPRAPSPRPR